MTEIVKGGRWFSATGMLIGKWDLASSLGKCPSGLKQGVHRGLRWTVTRTARKVVRLSTKRSEGPGKNSSTSVELKKLRYSVSICCKSGSINPALPLTSCVILGKLFKICVSVWSGKQKPSLVFRKDFTQGIRGWESKYQEVWKYRDCREADSS